MNFRNRFLVLFFSILFFQNLSADTITWKGNEGFWSDVSQWDLGKLPTAADDVLIESGTVNIGKKTLATANQIKLNGAKLNNSGRILIADASDTGIRIENFAVFKNLKKGRIEVLKAAENGIYIFNGAMLLNSGKILIGQQIDTRGFRGKQIGRNGLLIVNQSIFRNNNRLEINNTKEEAIHNVQLSIFANHKKIILGGENSLLQRHGLKNTAVFTNHRKGCIQIDGTYLDAIRNAESGTFENSGKIKVGKIKVISSYGIYCQDYSKFKNEKKGKITAYRILNGFVKKGKDAEFVDLGKTKEKKIKKKS